MFVNVRHLILSDNSFASHTALSPPPLLTWWHQVGPGISSGRLVTRARPARKQSPATSPFHMLHKSSNEWHLTQNHRFRPIVSAWHQSLLKWLTQVQRIAEFRIDEEQGLCD